MSFYRLKKRESSLRVAEIPTERNVTCTVRFLLYTNLISWAISFFLKAAVSKNFQYYADIICVADRVLEKGELSFRLNFWFVT